MPPILRITLMKNPIQSYSVPLSAMWAQWLLRYFTGVWQSLAMGGLEMTYCEFHTPVGSMNCL